ncbi:hypothetical protein BJ742DRAFT_358016 [Cladochytrium replicatum]|nr:hypothetical protein BJ742DRAFT_358016 [Cladochytrium replicatum]
MDDFDFYVSPSERFGYETQFTKYGKDADEVMLSQLEPLYQMSRLHQDEFMQIWNLCEIRGTGTLNKEQFIIFSHILNSRRRGRALPFSLPLSIKEAFLKEESRKSHVYVRPSATKNDADADELSEAALARLRDEVTSVTEKIRTAESDLRSSESQVADLKVAREELQELRDYKRRHLDAISADIAQIEKVGSSTSALGSAGDEALEAERLLGELKGYQAAAEVKIRELRKLMRETEEALEKERS